MARTSSARPARSAPATPRRLASVAVAAEYADVSDRTIRRYVALGRLAGYRIGPRLLKVDLDDVDRLMTPVPTADDGVA